MARDAAELKEVLQSVSTMLKPFYAQVIPSSSLPPSDIGTVMVCKS